MRPSELLTFLVATINERLPVLVTSAPGLGKSDITEQATALAKADIIISHPVVSDPTDAKGLPWVSEDKKSATFLPFGELDRALKAKKPTVWFLDDLGQASPAVQAAFMQLLLARRINGHELPKWVTFIAATNRRADRAGVQGVLEPVKSRFAAIVPLEVDHDDWVAWAIANNQPPELIAFLRFRRDLLHDFEPTAEIVNQPSPRTWHHAGRILKLGLPPTLELAGLQGAVGEGAAAEFVGFLRTYRELPNLDDIIKEPGKAMIPTGPAALYAVATGLASKANVQTFPSIVKYAERMLNERRAGEHATLLLLDCTRRDKGLYNTKAWTAMATSDGLGKLIAGED